MHAELIAEVGSAGAFAELARGWITGCMDEVFGPLAQKLREDPVTKASVQSLDLVGRIERAGPNQVLGKLITYRKHVGFRPSEVRYSTRSWNRFLHDFALNPGGMEVSMVPLDGDGVPLWRGTCSCGVRWEQGSPGWARFSFTAGAGPVTNWPESPGLQESWAGFVRGQAALVSASAGSMTDDMWPGTHTALQRATNSVPSNLLLKVSQSREVLLGYSWVTVVAAELAGRLGGSAAMAASGAFCEVEEMPGGALWLRATPVINEFTGGRVRKVFEALAPVLITGTARNEHRGEELRITEGVDAADYR